MTAAIDDRFPTLVRDGYRVTSRRDDRYNCVAWVVRDKDRWWAPGVVGMFWPRQVNESDLEDGDLSEYLTVFSTLGFARCVDGSLEDGFEKIAVYADGEDFGHVAFQTPDGEWSSKLGELNDIRHPRVESVAGSGFFEYPPASVFMRRPRQPHELADLPTGLILTA